MTKTSILFLLCSQIDETSKLTLQHLLKPTIQPLSAIFNAAQERQGSFRVVLVPLTKS